MRLWRELASDAGLPGLHLVGSNVIVGNRIDVRPPSDFGLDAWTTSLMPPPRPSFSRRTPIKWLRRKYLERVKRPTIHSYERIVIDLLGPEMPGILNYPCLIPNWDNTPRSEDRGMVYHGATPELFKRQAREALARVRGRNPEENFVFIKSWNEWAEGNHLEPDLRFGLGFLEVIREVFGSRSGHAHETAPRLNRHATRERHTAG
jgi:hypothetical protein